MVQRLLQPPSSKTKTQPVELLLSQLLTHINVPLYDTAVQCSAALPLRVTEEYA